MTSKARPAAAARTTIAVQGARVHNLKNISLEIPRDRLIVVTGLSGSGKSSLAFDTIYAEGQRRYMIAGFLGCLLWTFTLQRSFASHGIDSAEVGVVVSAFTFIVVSRLTKPTPAQNLRIFFDDVPAR